jgi:hypothetical protein
MSEEGRHTELREKTQQLLQGSLRHVRAAAIAAALVPLASVVVSRAVVRAQGPPSGGVATVPSPCDFVTSGGFVLTDPNNAMANFGAHGGCKLGGFWGHVNYVDHSTQYHVDSIQITGYLTPFQGSNIRDVCGQATTNRATDPQPVLFRIRLIDNGEPGIADQFGIRISNGVTDLYLVPTRLLNAGMGGGGNVQLHNDNPSTFGPNPPPTEAQMCGGVAAP